jgi:hypothetical protein
MEKIIWMLWFDGLQNAPLLVRHCVRSWQYHNPFWRVIVLENATLGHYVELDPVISGNQDVITPQASANIVRINLLRKYGGVWADATCYCCMPLDAWLPEVMSSGFFVFRDPGPDRIMSNWFIASDRHNHLTAEVCRRINGYWKDNVFAGMKYYRLRQLRTKLTNYTKRHPGRTDIWFTLIVRKLLRIFPLFWFHYLFAVIVNTNVRCREIWQRTSYRAADPIHAIQQHGQLEPVTDALQDRVSRKQEPMYKLAWKKAPFKNIPEESALGFLFSQITEDEISDGLKNG